MAMKLLLGSTSLVTPDLQPAYFFFSIEYPCLRAERTFVYVNGQSSTQIGVHMLTCVIVDSI